MLDRLFLREEGQDQLPSEMILVTSLTSCPLPGDYDSSINVYLEVFAPGLVERALRDELASTLLPKAERDSDWIREVIQTESEVLVRLGRAESGHVAASQLLAEVRPVIRPWRLTTGRKLYTLADGERLVVVDCVGNPADGHVTLLLPDLNLYGYVEGRRDCELNLHLQRSVGGFPAVYSVEMTRAGREWVLGITLDTARYPLSEADLDYMLKMLISAAASQVRLQNGRRVQTGNPERLKFVLNRI